MNEDLKEKFNGLLSVKNTLQNDLLTLQSLLDQEKSANNTLVDRLNEIDCKYDMQKVSINIKKKFISNEKLNVNQH